jgi:hypothetical protein
MCEPITTTGLILGGIGVASSVANGVQANMNANAQDKYGQMVSKMNADMAKEAMIADYTALGKRISEQEEAAYQEIEAAHKDSARLVSFMATSAGESGVSGQSLQGLLDTIKQQELDIQGSTIRQMEFARYAAEKEGRAVELQTKGRLISGMYMPAQRPGMLGTVLGAASAGLQGAMAGSNFDRYNRSSGLVPPGAPAGTTTGYGYSFAPRR